MTAKYWTKDGEVMCRLSVRNVFDFTNLDTGEVVTLDNMHDIIDTGFLPVIMPKVKTKKTPKVKKKKAPKAPKAAKKSKHGPRAKSKYKGVRREGKRYYASYWDGANKKAVHLGSYISELLATAAVQEALNNVKEARRLRNEYEEGNGRPEVTEPQVVHKAMYSSDE